MKRMMALLRREFWENKGAFRTTPLVIGGIYTIVKSERESRVPYLWRIPLIGVAFKSKEITDSRKELLMFVTPRIVQTPELASTR